MDTTNKPQYLICEHRSIYALLMINAGMMGAYTFHMRGGIFCNAQTANFVMIAIAFGKGLWNEAFYFFIPITAYLLGAMISELLPNPIKKMGFLRWDTYLIGFECIILFLVGFIPLTWSDHIVHVIINFIASMQYNTFRQAEGIPMATTFCTNHVRQIGIAISKMIRKKDISALKRGFVHFSMILYFLLGGILLTFFCKYLQEKAIWIALIPMIISFCILAHADMTIEHNLLDIPPHGH